MGNRYKRLTFIGIKVKREELVKQMGLPPCNLGCEVYEFFDQQKKVLNGHEKNVGKFGFISTDDDVACIGVVVDTQDNNGNIDLIYELESRRYSVSEALRRLNITIGEVKIHATTLCYWEGINGCYNVQHSEMSGNIGMLRVSDKTITGWCRNGHRNRRIQWVNAVLIRQIRLGWQSANGSHDTIPIVPTNQNPNQ